MLEESLDLHALRQRISARDKALITSKPIAEAIKLLKEVYKLSEDSAASFVNWQRSISSGDPLNPGNPHEKWHLKFDEETGVWTKVPQPGDHPQRRESP